MYTYVKHMCVCWLVSWETLVQAVVTTAELILQVRTVPQSGQSSALCVPHLCHPAFYYTL